MVGISSAIADLDRRYQAGRDVRRMFENQWVLNLAFGLGHQWVRVDGSGRIFNVGIGGERVTLTDNRMRPASRTNIARMTKSAPTWQGVPKDASDAEIARARLREAVFEHYWRELEMARRYRLVLWYREHCGMGFLKTVFDQTAGESNVYMAQKGGPVIADANGRPITPDRVQGVLHQLDDTQRSELDATLEERTVNFGDVVTTLKTPFEVVVDPLATDEGLSTAEYICEEALYSPAYLRSHFPDGDHNFEETGNPSAGALEARFPGMSAYLEQSRERRGAAGRRGVKCREYWSLPGVDDPKGRHCVWIVNGGLLLEEAIPYPYLPYSAFAGLPAGRFWADAPMTDLVSPQTQLNKVESQIGENGERFGNPARAISREALGAEDSVWQGLPGEEIVYHDSGSPNALPSFITPPNMPQYVMEQIPIAERSIAVISAQNEVVQGNVPQGVTAAAAISQLMEASNQQLGPDIDDMAISLLDVGRKVLWCVRRFAGDDRIARVAGEDSGWDLIEFKGEQLGGADGDALKIGSQIATSVAAKQAGIQWIVNTMIQNGQAPAPRELRRIFRDYEVGGLEHLFGGISKTQTQVVDEHRRLLAGEQLGVNTYDDDQVHVDEHQDFQRGSRYQLLALKPDGAQVQANVEAHVQLHRDRLQGVANNAAALELLKQGKPGQPPMLDPGALATPTGAPPAADPGSAPPGGALPSPAGAPSLNGAAG